MIAKSGCMTAEKEKQQKRLEKENLVTAEGESLWRLKKFGEEKKEWQLRLDREGENKCWEKSERERVSEDGRVNYSAKETEGGELKSRKDRILGWTKVLFFRSSQPLFGSWKE